MFTIIAERLRFLLLALKAQGPFSRIKELEKENLRLRQEVKKLCLSLEDKEGLVIETQWGNNILINVNTHLKPEIKTESQWGSNAMINVSLKDASDSEMKIFAKKALHIFKEIISSLEIPLEEARAYPWSAHQSGLLKNDEREVSPISLNANKEEKT